MLYSSLHAWLLSFRVIFNTFWRFLCSPPWKIRRSCFRARGYSNQLARRRGAHGRALLEIQISLDSVRSCLSRFLTPPSPWILSLLKNLALLVFLCFSCPGCQTSESHVFCPCEYLYPACIPMACHPLFPAFTCQVGGRSPQWTFSSELESRAQQR